MIPLLNTTQAAYVYVLTLFMVLPIYIVCVFHYYAESTHVSSREVLDDFDFSMASPECDSGEWAWLY